MIEIVTRLALAGMLGVSALAKLAAPASSQAALGTFGFGEGPMRRVAWGTLLTSELTLAVGVGAGLDGAAYAAAGLMVMFAAVLGNAIMRGRAGAPCACFGARSRVSGTAIVRNVALAAAFAALPSLPSAGLTTDEWLGLGLGAALLACAGLVVVVLALFREVGMLRLALAPQSALEIPDEGPPLGERIHLPVPLRIGAVHQLGLAVFTSSGCHACRALEPAIASLANEPDLAVETFEESRDAGAWADFGVPGSPYAVALGRDGTVLAKGTFNNLAQLESVIATAERRAEVPAVIPGA